MVRLRVFRLCSIILCALGIYLSLPRTIASLYSFPIKDPASAEFFEKKEYERGRSAIKEALNWQSDPNLYFLLENLLLHARYQLDPEERNSYVEERLSLLTQGLALTSCRPDKLARLAHILAIQKRYGDAQKILALSVTAGPYIQNIYFTRFRTISLLWVHLNEEQKEFFKEAIKLAFKYSPDGVVKEAILRKSAREATVFALLDARADLTKFYQLFLKGYSKNLGSS
jgi:hypothetical protein